MQLYLVFKCFVLFFSIFRITAFCNVSFYIAPSPVVNYRDITINISLPDACKEDTDNQPALIYWNPGKETGKLHKNENPDFSNSVDQPKDMIKFVHK